MSQASSDLSFPSIYCINLKTSKQRCERMEQRFKQRNFIDAVTFVEAIPRESYLVDYYTQQMTPPFYSKYKWRGEIACFASHLKAIREFVTHSSSGEDYALICEDDILCHNDFLRRYVEMINNAPPSTPLILLGYMIEKKDGLCWAGVEPEKCNLITLTKHIWGAQMYLISKEYAVKALSLYDRPLVEVESTLLTSEVIIQESGGMLVYPPMVIEDCIDSDRAPEDLPYHKKHFDSWGRNNYS